MPERPFEIVTVSEHLFRIGNDGLFQLPNRLVEDFYVSDAMLSKIYSDAEDSDQGGHLLRLAIDRATDEAASPVCRKGEDCQACIGGATINRKSAFRPETPEFPKQELIISVSCRNALARRNEPNLTGPAPIRIKRFVGNSGRKPEYDGVRIFDNSCHVELIGRAILASEIIAAEIDL